MFKKTKETKKMTGKVVEPVGVVKPTELTKDSPEVIAYLKEYPNISVEVAILALSK